MDRMQDAKKFFPSLQKEIEKRGLKVMRWDLGGLGARFVVVVALSGGDDRNEEAVEFPYPIVADWQEANSASAKAKIDAIIQEAVQRLSEA